MRRIEQVIVIHAELDPVAPGCCFHRLGFFQVDRHRLLDEDVAAGLHRLDGEGGVRLRGGDDVHDIGPVPLDQLGKGPGGIRDPEAGCRGLGAPLVRIGQPHDLCSRMGANVGDMHGCDLASSNDTDLHSVSSGYENC